MAGENPEGRVEDGAADFLRYRPGPARISEAMKASKSIFSHAAVFAVGIAIAVVARQPSGPGADSGDSSGHDRRASGTLGEGWAGGAEGSTVGSSRERREAAARGEKDREGRERKLEDIVHMGDPLDRQLALMEALKRLGPNDFAAFADHYRSLDHYGNSRGEFEMILRAWAKADPLGALTHAGQRPDGFGDQTVLLAAWAGNDAAAAERWALDHHQGDGPNPFLVSVIRGVAVNDIAHASELAASMANSRERGEAMEAITRALMVQGKDAAMAFPNTIQDPDMRGGYISMIADRLANRDAKVAADWIASFSDADSQNRGARRVADALARQDLNQAAAWVRKLDPAAQAEAARGVVQPMSSGDIPGTAKWVSTLNGIPNYDKVVEEFVWSCDVRSPEQSAAWIAGMSDPAQRTRLYHRMLGEWARRDPNAVKNWVANNKVPDSVAQRFNR